MSATEHYWLFHAGTPKEVEDSVPIVAQPFMTLEEARRAALDLGGDVDIFGTPGAGGGWRFVEHVEHVERPRRDKDPWDDD